MLSKFLASQRAFHFLSSRAMGSLELASKDGTFYRKDLGVKFCSNRKSQVVSDTSLKFGAVNTDHLLIIDWDAKNGWNKPSIEPYHKFEIDPMNTTLHYAIQCFEGFKAFRDAKNNIRLFRPEMNMARFKKSCYRLCLPDFDGGELLECIKEHIRIDSQWVPDKDGFSLYVRPTAISMTEVLGVRAPDKARIFVVLCPVGPYYPSGFKPVSLYCDKDNIRSFPKGFGHYKLGANYGPTLRITRDVEKKGYAQCLWLGGDHIAEVGTSNIFFLWMNEQGEKELITPELDGTILPGVVRDTVLQVTRGWNKFKVTERKVTIQELVKALSEKRVLEAFGAGTAVTVGPIEDIHYDGVDYKIPIDPKINCGPVTKEIADFVADIQYGRKEHPWSTLLQSGQLFVGGRNSRK